MDEYTFIVLACISLGNGGVIRHRGVIYHISHLIPVGSSLFMRFIDCNKEIYEHTYALKLSFYVYKTTTNALKLIIDFRHT